VKTPGPPAPAGRETRNDERPEDEQLRSRVLGGFAWGAASAVVTQAWRIVAAVLLARLLTPGQYGLAAETLVFSSLVLTFSDLSMGSALVQRRQINEEDRSTVFWTSAGIGVLLMLCGMAVSGVLASFYGQPRVQPLFMVVSLSFLFVALQTTQSSLLQREMRFRAINIRVSSGIIFGGIAGVTAAALGAGAWSLIAQELSASFISMVLLWTFSSWRPHFTYSRRSLKDLGGFGLNLLSARLLSYVNRNADNLLVGRYLGAAPLGAYSVAYNLMVLPLDRLILPIQETLYPAYSKWQDDRERLRDVWLRVFRIVAFLVFPAMVGLCIVAPDFVRVVLGEKWHAAIPVLQILSFVAIVQSMAALCPRALTAIDRTRAILRFAFVEVLVTVPAFAIGLHWGIVGVAVCYSIVSIPLNAVLTGFTAHAIEVTAPRLLRTLRGVTVATAIMGGVCLAARHSLVAAGAASWLRLLIVATLGAVVYFGMSPFLQPQVLEEARRLRAKRSRTPGPTTTAGGASGS
jgi:O-antigen/teichoic acid export membrane protein